MRDKGVVEAGVKWRSTFLARRYRFLRWLEQQGTISDLEIGRREVLQPTFTRHGEVWPRIGFTIDFFYVQGPAGRGTSSGASSP